MAYMATTIARDRPAAGLRFLDAAEHPFADLVRNPGAGTHWESEDLDLAGVRVRPVKRFRNYLIFYRPTPDGVEVIRVLHGARDLDRLLDEMVQSVGGESMTTLNVSLPGDFKPFLDAEAAARGFDSVDDYVCFLVTDAMLRKHRDRVEKLILEGLNSGEPIEVTPEFWEKFSREVDEKYGKADDV
jgi:toxin ParE1/3/4